MVRSALGLTQKQLAKRLQTLPRMVGRLEREEVDPRLSTLEKLANALDCKLLIRFVPKQDLKELLYERAKIKAEKLVHMSAGSAGLELQKPSGKAIQSEIKRLTEEIIHRKRSSLWED